MRDLTVKVVGTNKDGTVQLQVPDDNPFGGGSTAQIGGMPQQQQQGFPARLPSGQLVTFASYEDFQAADAAFRRMTGSNGGGQSIPTIGGGGQGNQGGGQGGGMNLLRTTADAAEVVTGFLRGRAINQTINDYNDSIANLDAAATKLEALSASKYGDLIPILLAALQAERDATTSALTAIEDELTAVDLMTGANAVGLVSDFVSNANGGGGSGSGTALAIGGAAIGAGLLLSGNNNNNGRRRRSKGSIYGK